MQAFARAVRAAGAPGALRRSQPLRRLAAESAAEAEAAAEAAREAAAANRRKWRNRILAAVVLPPVAAPVVFAAALKLSPEFRRDLREKYPGQMDEVLDHFEALDIVEIETPAEKAERTAPPPFDDEEELVALVTTTLGQVHRVPGVRADASLADVKEKLAAMGVREGVAGVDFEDSALREVDEASRRTAFAGYSARDLGSDGGGGSAPGGAPAAKQQQDEAEEEEETPTSTWPAERPKPRLPQLSAEERAEIELTGLREREAELHHERRFGTREIDAIEQELARVHQRKREAKAALPGKGGSWKFW